MMPPTGAAVRAERLATLERVAHERFVDDRIGELVDELRELEASLPFDSDDASLIRVTRRDWEKARRVPADLAADLTKAASEGMEAWVVARAENDYAAFRPWLDRQLALKHEYIACFEPADDPYDVLLDDFEPGTTTAEVRDRLRPAQGRARAADRSGRRRRERRPRHGPFPEDGQRTLALAVMTAFGFDPASFRLDTTVHPFCSSFATTDIRVTTRYNEDDLESLFSCMHEIGHGLYERGISPTLERTAARLRLLVGVAREPEQAVGERRRPLAALLPLASSPARGDVSGRPRRDHARALPPRDQPRRSLRSSASTPTRSPTGCTSSSASSSSRSCSPGALSTADLPAAWNARFEEYLGLAVPDDRLGVLQDVHWSCGLFGYFPTYQLGNVMSVQIWEAAQAALPGLEEQFERGDFSALGRGCARTSTHSAAS